MCDMRPEVFPDKRTRALGDPLTFELRRKIGANCARLIVAWEVGADASLPRGIVHSTDNCAIAPKGTRFDYIQMVCSALRGSVAICVIGIAERASYNVGF